MPITDQAAEAFIRAKDGLDAATAVLFDQADPGATIVRGPNLNVVVVKVGNDVSIQRIAQQVSVGGV